MKRYPENIDGDCSEMLNFSLIYTGILILASAWFFLIFAVPVWIHGNAFERTAADLIRLFFAPVCHQIPERSFQLSGHSLAVCARCTGLYGGVVAGLLFYPVIKTVGNKSIPPPRVLLFSAIPTMVEWILSHLNLVESSNWIRSLAGSVLGAAVVFWLLPAAFQLVDFKTTIKR